jgi:SAM-dependent methyltransferase
MTGENVYGDFEGRELMRTEFDTVAEDYDRVRNRYPEEIFNDLVDLAGLSSGARVVEVGCGTGQATLPLAQRGLSVVAVELGEHLAALARRRLAVFPNVEVVQATFEEWEPSGTADFAAVISFAAFHWVDPNMRYVKAARLLKPQGAIAIVDWQDTLSQDGDPFFVAVQEDYAAVVPEWKMTAPLPSEAIVDRDRVKQHIDASGCFEPADVRHYVWSVTYSARDYVTLLGTMGSFLVLDEERRSRLFRRIERRITDNHDGVVRKRSRGRASVSALLAPEAVGEATSNDRFLWRRHATPQRPARDRDLPTRTDIPRRTRRRPDLRSRSRRGTAGSSAHRRGRVAAGP